MPTRLVLFAPHPDDEVLGAAGLMTWCDVGGCQVEIVAITDGGASHPQSSAVTPAELQQIRRDERKAALDLLDLGHIPVHELGLPDGDVGGCMGPTELADSMASFVGINTTIAVPSRFDDHPDHQAVYRAGCLVSSARNCAIWEYAVWARIRHSDRQLGQSLQLGRELQRKKMAAAMCYRSQILPLGPQPHDGPVINAHALASFTGSTETIAMNP